VPAHPLLTGERETLRRLRAAERTAWESPWVAHLTPSQEVKSHRDACVSMPHADRARKSDKVLLALALGALAAVLPAECDVNGVLAAGVRFLNRIRNLLF
jgi:hypothetical protein